MEHVSERAAVALAWLCAECVFLGMRHRSQKTHLFLAFPRIPDALAAHLWPGNSQPGGEMHWAVFCPCLPSGAFGFSFFRLSPYPELRYHEHCVLKKVAS